MLSNTNALRGRNVEDIGDLEEKGLLRRTSDDKGSGSGGARFEKVDTEERYEPGLKSKRDQQAFALLVVLCESPFLLDVPSCCPRLLSLTPDLLQGVPLGLTFGTLPFLLKPRLSYSALAVFALSTWPYSLKLLWSAVVDSWFVPKWGRRKSWIVPVQAIVGIVLYLLGGRVEGWLNAEVIDVHWITFMFGSLIFAAATQGGSSGASLVSVVSCPMG